MFEVLTALFASVFFMCLAALAFGAVDTIVPALVFGFLSIIFWELMSIRTELNKSPGLKVKKRDLVAELAWVMIFFIAVVFTCIMAVIGVFGSSGITIFICGVFSYVFLIFTLELNMVRKDLAKLFNTQPAGASESPADNEGKD